MRRMSISMIRTWVMFYGLQSQSMLIKLPFSGTGCVSPAPMVAFSPTRPAWRFLPGKYSPRRKDALTGGLSHVFLIVLFITVWGKCRNFGKSFFGS